MDYRKIAASSNTETRDVMKLSEPVGNKRKKFPI